MQIFERVITPAQQPKNNNNVADKKQGEYFYIVRLGQHVWCQSLIKNARVGLMFDFGGHVELCCLCAAPSLYQKQEIFCGEE